MHHDSILQLSTLHSLSSITLDGMTHLTDDQLLVLSSCSQLEQLSIRDLPTISDEPIVNILEAIGGNIRVLHFSGCSLLTDVTLEAIKCYCTVLQSIDIGHTRISATGVMHLFTQESLGSLGVLEYVAMSGLSITDAEMIALCMQYGSPLVHIDVSSCSLLTGKSIVALARHCKHLQTLNISFVRGMKEDAIGALIQSNSNLTQLDIWGCTQLTDTFFQSSARPGLAIVGRFNNCCY